ncbi:hypothetical protein P43SY_006391 [Pythium insidiosum]|uniref:Ty3 transposon capsid-like protein domain-containing protein n=1 Tax=Pythium insidiosum TaxID=114742 RepID=A0AAD5Q6I5_PYTIN|nr:hypothetical protein P43SY_006391 [Pythium insidiosum]
MREEDDAPTQAPGPAEGASHNDADAAAPNHAPGPTAEPPQPRMEQMMSQQTAFMNPFLAANAQAQRRSQQRKGNPPTFDGKESEDPDRFVYGTEKFYGQDCKEMMEANTSEFTTMIYPNFGPVAQAFFHELEMSLMNEDGSSWPLTWPFFNENFLNRFREKDFEFKLLTKLYSLKVTTTQQAYTTRFLHLLSQLPPIPELIKRWLYQQNLRADTSAFISQNVPQTLSEVIEYAQRYEDSRRSQPGHQGNAPRKNNKGKSGAAADEKLAGEKWCAFCSLKSHNTAECRKKKAAETAAAAGKREAAPKNG